MPTIVPSVISKPPGEGSLRYITDINTLDQYTMIGRKTNESSVNEFPRAILG
jgi:hypothetical protein